MLNYPYEMASKFIRKDYKHDDLLQFITKTREIYDNYRSFLTQLEDTRRDLHISEQTVKLLQVEDECQTTKNI